jgi:hypothetical protein
VSERAEEFLREIREEFGPRSPAADEGRALTRVERQAVAIGHAIDEWGHRNGAVLPEEAVEAAHIFAAAVSEGTTAASETRRPGSRGRDEWAIAADILEPPSGEGSR